MPTPGDFRTAGRLPHLASGCKANFLGRRQPQRARTYHAAGFLLFLLPVRQTMRAWLNTFTKKLK